MKNTAYSLVAILGLCWVLIGLVIAWPLAAPVLAQVPSEEALFRGDETPLMKAAAHGRIATMRQLLAGGAAVDARN